MSQRPSVLARGWNMFGGNQSTEPVDEHGTRVAEPPKTAAPEVSTFSEKEKDREYPHSDVERSTSSAFSGSTLVRKFGSLLIGRGEEPGKKYGSVRRSATQWGGGISSATSRPSEDVKPTETAKENGAVATASEMGEAGEKGENERTITAKGMTPSVSQPASTVHRRAATILDTQGRATRHERRSSTGAAFMGASSSLGGSVRDSNTLGRHRRPSTGYGAGGSKPGDDRTFTRKTEGEAEAEKKEDEEGQANGAQEHGEVGGPTDTEDERDDGHQTDKDFKPVFMKGLFRYVFIHDPHINESDVHCLASKPPQQNRPSSSRPTSAACSTECKSSTERRRQASSASTCHRSISPRSTHNAMGTSRFHRTTLILRDARRQLILVRASSRRPPRSRLA